jgi:peptidyl-dipeptidase A
MKPLIILLPLLFTFLLMFCSLQSDENALRAFIDNHVKLIEPKNKAKNLADWNASATGEKKFYDEKASLEVEINKIYSNKKDFEQLKRWKDAGNIKDSLLQRQLILLFNNYLINQMDTALMQKIVEKSAEISNKFNVFRGTINGKEVTDNELVDILQKETNNAKRKKAWEASKMVGKAVAPMLIELAKLRNEAARQLGFKNYYEMSLIAAEQSESEIIAIFDELKKLTDTPFRQLKSDIDSKLAKKWGIKVSEMRPWHYQDRFFQEAPQVGTINLDKYFKSKKVDEIASSFYAHINLPVEDVLKNSDLYERKGKYQHAFETDIDHLGDIRVMLNVKDNHSWMSTMLHELGHAAYSKNIRRDLPYLLRAESHIFVTEAIAMLMERQASNVDWLQATVGIPEKDREAIQKTGEENLRMQGLIFSRWTQVMMRFERAMYENPDQDLNKLWWDLVEEYQFVKRPEGRNEPDWAAKIHLAQSPVYYHNYELGELTACQLQHYIIHNILKEQSGPQPSYLNRVEIGDYLKTHVFAPGTSLRWDALIKEATGEPLSAKYFAEEYVK